MPFTGSSTVFDPTEWGFLSFEEFDRQQRAAFKNSNFGESADWFTSLPREEQEALIEAMQYQTNAIVNGGYYDTALQVGYGVDPLPGVNYMAVGPTLMGEAEYLTSVRRHIRQLSPSLDPFNESSGVWDGPLAAPFFAATGGVGEAIVGSTGFTGAINGINSFVGLASDVGGGLLQEIGGAVITSKIGEVLTSGDDTQPTNLNQYTGVTGEAQQELDESLEELEDNDTNTDTSEESVTDLLVGQTMDAVFSGESIGTNSGEGDVITTGTQETTMTEQVTAEELDTNDDGTVSNEEREELDTNEDGEISREEMGEDAIEGDTDTSEDDSDEEASEEDSGGSLLADAILAGIGTVLAGVLPSIFGSGGIFEGIFGGQSGARIANANTNTNTALGGAGGAGGQATSTAEGGAGGSSTSTNTNTTGPSTASVSGVSTGPSTATTGPSTSSISGVSGGAAQGGTAAGGNVTSNITNEAPKTLSSLDITSIIGSPELAGLLGGLKDEKTFDKIMEEWRPAAAKYDTLFNKVSNPETNPFVSRALSFWDEAILGGKLPGGYQALLDQTSKTTERIGAARGGGTSYDSGATAYQLGQGVTQKFTELANQDLATIMSGISPTLGAQAGVAARYPEIIGALADVISGSGRAEKDATNSALALIGDIF